LCITLNNIGFCVTQKYVLLDHERNEDLYKTFTKVKPIFKSHKTLPNCKQEVASSGSNRIPRQSLVYDHGRGELRKTMEFYVVRTVHFGMTLYNDKRNAQVFNLFIDLLLSIYFCLTCFGLSFSRNCTPAFEDELEGSPNHVRQN
jgi:hypothetical protein